MINSLILALQVATTGTVASELRSEDVVTILRNTACVESIFDLSTAGSVEAKPVPYLDEEGLQYFAFYSHGPSQFCIDELLTKIPGAKRKLSIQNAGAISAPVID